MNGVDPRDKAVEDAAEALAYVYGDGTQNRSDIGIHVRDVVRALIEEAGCIILIPAEGVVLTERERDRVAGMVSSFGLDVWEVES